MPRQLLEQRVLVVAPTSADAALCTSVLSEAGLGCAMCTDLPHLAAELARGAAAVLLTDESLTAGEPRALIEVLEDQPAWSDLPIVLLCGTGADSPVAAWALDVLGNVTVLDRPIRVMTLISALRAACRARQRQYQLRESDQRKDEFLATLSHELRNPLAPLRNSLHLLRLTGKEGAATRPVYELMERQVDQLVRLVDDLLELSRVTRGALELRVQRIELAAVVRSAVETSEPLIAAGRHDLRVSLPERPLWLDGDPVRLAQIISNLLNNAAKYTPPGGQIAIEAHRGDGMALVSVRDNGTGISREALPSIFEMFSRGDRAQHRGEAGLGIGLAIARRLAEMHGGALEARSEGVGLGSEFIVRLPLTAAGAVGDETGGKVEAWLPARRILVVDDNRDAADSLAMLLDALGAEVRVARDGPEALQAFEAYAPTVVLLDIGMPGMDGYEVARRLRARFPQQRAAIVALTGWGQEEDLRRAQAAGFDHHLVKPADIGALQALLLSLERSPVGRDPEIGAHAD